MQGLTPGIGGVGSVTSSSPSDDRSNNINVFMKTITDMGKMLDSVASSSQRQIDQIRRNNASGQAMDGADLQKMQARYDEFMRAMSATIDSINRMQNNRI